MISIGRVRDSSRKSAFILSDKISPRVWVISRSAFSAMSVFFLPQHQDGEVWEELGAEFSVFRPEFRQLGLCFGFALPHVTNHFLKLKQSSAIEALVSTPVTAESQKCEQRGNKLENSSAEEPAVAAERVATSSGHSIQRPKLSRPPRRSGRWRIGLGMSPNNNVRRPHPRLPHPNRFTARRPVINAAESLRLAIWGSGVITDHDLSGNSP